MADAAQTPAVFGQTAEQAVAAAAAHQAVADSIEQLAREHHTERQARHDALHIQREQEAAGA